MSMRRDRKSTGTGGRGTTLLCASPATKPRSSRWRRRAKYSSCLKRMSDSTRRWTSSPKSWQSSRGCSQTLGQCCQPNSRTSSSERTVSVTQSGDCCDNTQRLCVDDRLSEEETLKSCVRAPHEQTRTVSKYQEHLKSPYCIDFLCIHISCMNKSDPHCQQYSRSEYKFKQFLKVPYLSRLVQTSNFGQNKSAVKRSILKYMLHLKSNILLENIKILSN